MKFALSNGEYTNNFDEWVEDVNACCDAHREKVQQMHQLFKDEKSLRAVVDALNDLGYEVLENGEEIAIG